MIEARNMSGKHLMTGMNNRFTKESQFIRQLIDEGWFGNIYHIRCGWVRQRGIPGKGSWFTDRARSGGGPLIDLGVHMLDLALWLPAAGLHCP